MARAERPSTAPAYRWRPWKLAAIAFAAILVAGGAALAFASGATRETASTAPAMGPASTARGGGADSLLPGSNPVPSPLPEPPSAEPTPEGSASEVPWSPALLRGGLSFFVAFGVGYALRAFLRIGLFFVGLWAASLFLLASLGWVEVHWSAIDAAFSGWAAGLGSQFESASRFVTGSLPSAGMAGLGLYTGLRRR